MQEWPQIKLSLINAVDLTSVQMVENVSKSVPMVHLNYHFRILDV